MTRYRFTLRGPGCSGCFPPLREKLRALGAGIQLFGPTDGKTELLIDTINEDAVKDAVVSLGHTVLCVEQTTTFFEKKSEKARKWYQYLLYAGLLLAIGLPFMLVELLGIIPMPDTSIGLLLGIIFCGVTALITAYVAKDFFVSAGQEIKTKTLGMNSLFTLGIMAAFLYAMLVLILPDVFMTLGGHAHLADVLIVTGIVCLSRGLKDWADNKVKNSSDLNLDYDQLLQEKQPIFVIRENRDGGLERILFNQVQEGDRIQIEHNWCGVEGIYLGKDTIKVQAPSFCGEKKHLDLISGGRVCAGMQFIPLTDDPLYVQVKAPNEKEKTEDSIYETLLKLAQDKEVKPFSLIDRVSRWFAPTIIGLALVGGLLWGTLAPNHPWAYALMTFCLILLCACPCAFALASPLSTATATAYAEKELIFIKTATALEAASCLTTVCFDKTGTLTEPFVSEKDFSPETFTQEDWQAILALESQESILKHPLAQAIIQYVRKKYPTLEIATQRVSEIHRHPWGIEGRVNGVLYKFGNLSPINNDADENPAVSWLSLQKTDQILGAIPIGSRVKQEGWEVVKFLKDKKIDLYLLTGDEEGPAQTVAKKLGIENVCFRQTQEEKLEKIRQLQSSGQIVAMIGDGFNDLSAIKTAQVGIAVGLQVDARLSAPIVFGNGDLKKLIILMNISKKLRNNIKQNITIAMIYNILSISIAGGILYLAFGFFSHPIISSLAMGLSSLLVIANAARLKSILNPKKPTLFFKAGMALLLTSFLGFSAAILCTLICGMNFSSLFLLNSGMPFCIGGMIAAYGGALGLLILGVTKLTLQIVRRSGGASHTGERAVSEIPIRWNSDDIGGKYDDPLLVKVKTDRTPLGKEFEVASVRESANVKPSGIIGARAFRSA